MTGTIDVRLHTEHPDEPLDRHYVFVGSPDAPRIVNVPTKIGDWEISEVYVSTSLPDGTMHSAQATLVDGTYVATLPKCDVVGVVEGGFQIVCNGTDETGEAFEGLCLGVGDLEVLPRNGQIHVGETVHFFRIVDTVPAAPKRGDAAAIDGAWMWYDGTQWLPFGGGAPVEVVPASFEAGDGNAASAKTARNITDENAYTTSSSRFTWTSDDPNLPEGWLEVANAPDANQPTFDNGFWLIPNIGGKKSVRDEPGTSGDKSINAHFWVGEVGEASFSATATASIVPDALHKLAKRTATPTPGRVAKFDADGSLVDATPSSEEETGDLRSPTDNICHKTERVFSDWIADVDLPPGLHLQAQPEYIDQGHRWAWRVLDDKGYMPGSFLSYAAKDSLEINDWEGFGAMLGNTMTSSRSSTAVCTNGEIFTTKDYVESCISADSQSFSAAVEEVIRRINNAQ